jgi:hypothetical protein
METKNLSMLVAMVTRTQLFQKVDSCGYGKDSCS